jgi:predicted nucleic acid-binding protein
VLRRAEAGKSIGARARDHAVNLDGARGVEAADVIVAKGLVLDHTRLSARDAVHAAVMQRRQITEILSFDGGFDEIAVSAVSSRLSYGAEPQKSTGTGSTRS